MSKTTTAYTTIENYISKQPSSLIPVLQRLHDLIKATVPAAVGSISYGMPAYKYNGKPLVYFAVNKAHIGLYALPSSNIAFKKELEKYQTSKGTVRFPIDEPLPFTLIKKIVQFRKKEIDSKV